MNNDSIFVMTYDKATCEKLRKMGLQEIQLSVNSDSLHAFLNCKNVNFDGLDIFYSNKLYI